MNAMVKIIKEQFNSVYLILRLSRYELKSSNNNNYLGIMWEIISPMIQIAVYWFVFGTIRKGQTVEVNGQSIIYFDWLLAGIVVWFFINQAILQGAKSVYTRVRMVSKMNFPMSVIPSYVVTAKFYQHLMLLAVIFVILQFTDYKASIFIIQLPYFMFATLALIISISLITSTLTTIIRDTQVALQSLMRVLLYLTSILWPIQMLPEWLQNIMKINPFYYIVEGYRSSLLGTSWYMVDDYKYTLYFWVLLIILLLIGSMFHIKFRNRFVDFL